MSEEDIKKDNLTEGEVTDDNKSDYVRIGSDEDLAEFNMTDAPDIGDQGPAEDEQIPDEEEALIDVIIDISEGRDEDGNSRSSIALELSSLDVKTQQFKTLSSPSSANTAAYFGKRYNFIELKLDFDGANSPDLHSFWSAFERYGKELNELKEGFETAPSLSLAVVPYAGVGIVYIRFDAPLMWALSAEDRGGAVKQIRALFMEDDVTFYRGEGAPMEDIIADEQRRMQRKQEARLAAEEREAERKKFEAERQKLYAEILRNNNNK